MLLLLFPILSCACVEYEAQYVPDDTPAFPMSLTKGEKKEFRKNSICHICEEKIEGDIKVRDHCHLTGKYRGPAHSRCHLNYKPPNFIPAFLTTMLTMTHIYL